MNHCESAAAAVEFDISGLEAMLAGTLCLMSAYSHCECSHENNQGLIGLKIVSNLSCLQRQNSLSPEFRKVLSKVCESWRQHSYLAQSRQAQTTLPVTMPSAFWHTAPSTVQ